MAGLPPNSDQSGLDVKTVRVAENHRSTVAVEPVAAVQIADRRLAAKIYCRGARAYLASVVPAAIWRSTPPSGRGRSIAAIIAHMQGVRRTFARMGGARPGPPPLDKRRVTYLMQHDAHHRGQICLLARDLGRDFSGDDTMRLWGWKAIAPPGATSRQGSP